MIPEGYKFGCIALEALCDIEGDPIMLEEGLSVHFSLPFEIDPSWERSMGTFFTEKLSRANLFFLATAPSEKPETLDDENQLLIKIVRYYLFATAIYGAKLSYMTPVQLAGANDEGIRVREVRHERDFEWLSDDVHPIKIDENGIRKIAKMAQQMRRIFMLENEFQRFKRGINALCWGLVDSDLWSRTHQMVRSLEAVTLPDKQTILKHFAKRCEALVMPCQEDNEVFKELYRIRSKVEHMEEIETILTRIPELERGNHILKRAEEVELVSQHVYQRILSNDALLSNFRSDEAIKSFWEKPDHEQLALWGERLNITSLLDGRKKYAL